MFWNWGKTKINRERILALDLLRGSFLLVIITTHVKWSPSLYTFIGGGGALFASAAEGFFTISGLLVGYLYGPKILKDTKKIFKKIWKRAALLYCLAVFFTLFYTAWAVLEPNSAVYQDLYSREPWRFLVDTFTIRYAFGWADFLTRYAAFMLVAPFAVWLIAKHKAWVVALVSFVIWFLFRETDRFLPFASWQIVFMYGIILGYYLPYIEDWFRKLSKNSQRMLFVFVSGVAFVSYVMSMFIFVIGPLQLHNVAFLADAKQTLEPFFNKDHIAPGRIAVGVVWFAALYMIFRRFEKQISKHTYGVLEVLGKQSLFVYCFHAFVLFIVDMYFRPPAISPIPQNTLVTTFVIVIIYIAAYYRGHVTKIGKQLLSKPDTSQVP